MVFELSLMVFAILTRAQRFRRFEAQWFTNVCTSRMEIGLHVSIALWIVLPR